MLVTWKMALVAVVTDSCACLPPDLAEKYQVTVVPTIIIVGDQEYRDGVDITPRRLYEIQRQSKVLPTTSAPSPGDFLRVYRQLAEHTRSILQLTISANFSMAYNSALRAREMARDSLPEVDIKVVDTQTAAGAQGLLVLEAARLAADGAAITQVVQRVQALISRVQLLATLDTLYFLAKGGRVPKVAAWAGALLSIKPILELRRGKVELLEVVRARPKAMRRMLDLMEERIGWKRAHVMLMHGDAEEEAKRLSQQLSARFDCAELYLSDMTPVLGAHSGPGVVGVSFYAEE